jgi:GAF domain-containing protein
VATTLGAIADEAAGFAGAKVAAIWIADDVARTLTVAAVGGDDAGSLPLATLPYGHGGVGWVAAHREVLHVGNVFADSRFVGLDWRRSHRLSSFLGLPLIVEDRLHGVLALDGSAPMILTATQLDQLADLARRAATILDDSRRHEELRRREAEIAATRAEAAARARELSALIAVAAVLGGAADLAEALRRICRELAAVTAADTVGAYLLDPQRNEVYPVAGYHVPEAVRKGLAGARLAVGDTRFGDLLFREQRLIWSDDAPHDERFVNAFFARFPHQSCAFVPVLAKASMPGVLHLIWWTQVRRLSANEIALLQAIGQQAGVMLDNARLLEAERRAEALRAATSLANAAAHEINNPLAVIVGNLELMTRDGYGDARRLERVLAAAKRIADIVRRMSRITRLANIETSGQLPPMLDLRRSSDDDPSIRSGGDATS